MPQTLPFSGAVLYDFFNADGLLKIGSALEDEMGTKVGSNVRLFDGLLQSQNNQIVLLQSQLTQLVQDNYTIYYVELIKDTTVTTFSSYTGNNNKFTELKEDYIYLLKFDSNNVGNVQININALGFVNAFKVDTGIPIVFQDDDIATSVPYLFLYKGGQFIFVGENDVQKLKELDTDIATLQDNITTINSNLTSEIMARDPQNKRVDAFLASNQDMTGFSVPITYTPIVDNDSTLSAIEKISAQQNQQDTEITTLEQRVDSLYGAVIYLGTVEEHLADITQTILTDRAETILTNRGMSTDLKQGYTLVDLDLNDWWYDETDSLWVNIGYSSVGTATNTTKGIVMGDTAEGKISIDANATMTANGVMLESIYAPDATAVIDGSGLSITSTFLKSGTSYDVKFIMPDGYVLGTPIFIDGAEMSELLDSIGSETELDVVAGIPITLTRQGNRAFFKTGGGGLNFKVIAVADESNLPSTAKEYTIALIAPPVSIAGKPWISPNAPTGDDLYTGRLWINNGYVSPIIVQSDKNHFDYMSVPKIYGGTSFNDTKAYVFIGGTWESFNIFMFLNGREMSPPLILGKGSSAVAVNMSKTISGQNMTIAFNGGTSTAAYTVLLSTPIPIDITNYTNLKFRGISSTMASNNFWGMAISTTPVLNIADGIADNAPTNAIAYVRTGLTMNIDLTGRTGEVYAHIWGRAYSNRMEKIVFNEWEFE